jgi:hypothetical protein
VNNGAPRLEGFVGTGLPLVGDAPVQPARSDSTRIRNGRMPTQEDLDAAGVYTSIMEEAKFRALSINTLTMSKIGLPVPLLREFCFLELRMLCELIALGCLVAHGDIEETKSPALQRNYHAGDIVKRLEKLHPISILFRVNRCSARGMFTWRITTATI